MLLLDHLLDHLFDHHYINSTRFTRDHPELRLWLFVILFNTTLATMAMVSGFFFNVLAPYGGTQSTQPSHIPTWMWGPKINSKLGWYIMELPALFAAVGTVVYFDVEDYMHSPMHCQFAVGLYLVHYFNRGVLFPSKRGNVTSLESSATFVLGAFFNAGNAYAIVRYLTHFGLGASLVTAASAPTPLEQATPFRIIGATVVFFIGAGINMISDELLLRFSHEKKLEPDPKVQQAMVPGGFFIFEYVTAGNYFGELMEWLGFFWLTYPSPASACFLYMTFCNLAPRAWSRHQRYKREIKGYTELNRCAIIPFVL